MEKGDAPPVEDAPDTPATLKTLRSTYRTARGKLEIERARKAEPLYALYLTALENHVAELKKASNLAQAQQAEVFLGDIAREKAALAPSAGGVPP